MQFLTERPHARHQRHYGDIALTRHPHLSVSRVQIAVVLLALLGAVQCAAARDAAGVIDSKVDVDGYRLHFRVIPGCALTILLESGGGLDASQWSGLQPQLHQATGAAVVSYDRAGFGSSDLPKSSYRLADEVAGLQRGLTQLGVPPPVVLVGHSYGAFLVQEYAKNHPRNVKGVVLIDPNTVRFMDAIGGARQLPWNIPADTPHKRALASARVRDAFADTIEMARRAPLPDTVPVTVIAAEKRWWPTDEFNVAFAASRQALVTGFANRRLVVAEGSGHMIPEERPDVVLSEIESMVRIAQRSLPFSSCAKP